MLATVPHKARCRAPSVQAGKGGPAAGGTVQVLPTRRFAPSAAETWSPKAAARSPNNEVANSFPAAAQLRERFIGWPRTLPPYAGSARDRAADDFGYDARPRRAFSVVDCRATPGGRVPRITRRRTPNHDAPLPNSALLRS